MDDIKNTLQKQKEDNKVLWQKLADLHNQFAAWKDSAETNFSILFHVADNFGYEVCDAKFRENAWHPQIMSIEDTIDEIVEHKKSIVRILCPAESDFDCYEEIYGEAVKQPKDRLMLLALGPTASVLAYDLALQGYQAVDIGHADLSYEVLLKGKSSLSDTVVSNKYNNEAPDGNLVEDIHDAVYESQIIADFH